MGSFCTSYGGLEKASEEKWGRLGEEKERKLNEGEDWEILVTRMRSKTLISMGERTIAIEWRR